MEFNEKNADAILATINKKCAPYVCPMCKKQTNFLFGKAESQLMSFKREGHQINFNENFGFIPVLVGYCQNCGYIAQFNLNVINP